MTTHGAAPRGMRTFFIIWAGQLVSLIGSGLTGFALSVYVYQTTGSATQLSLVLLANALPSLFLAPIAGALVDRWDRRRVMLVSDAAAGVITLALWFLLSAGKLQMWHIYLSGLLGSSFGVFQTPAYMASTTLLVPKEHYGRVAGLVQLGGAVRQIVSPILAGFLVVVINIEGVLLIDLATFLFAVLTLARVQIPNPESTQEGRAGQGSLWREARYGWVYLLKRPGLLGMLLLFACVNFSLALSSALFTPLILSFSTAAVLGMLLSVNGAGMLVGSTLMSAWGGARRKVNSLMLAMFLMGITTSLMGLQANPWFIGAAGLGFFALLPIASGSSQAIWQAKVAPDVQGRVFAARATIAHVARPLAFILAGPLTDDVFEPLMAPGGALAGSVGALTGVGPGRGIGLIFIIIGLFITLSTVVGYLNPRLRLVEDELQDYVSAPAGNVPAKRAAATA